MGRADVFERMRADHQYVLKELDVLDEAIMSGKAWTSGGERPTEPVMRVLSMLARQFGTHMAAEDEILFPALIETLPQTRSSIEPLRADHDALREMLAALTATLEGAPSAARNEQIAILIRDLVDLLRIHIRKEEAVVISVAERVLRPREVEALAIRMGHGERKELREGPGEGPMKGAES